MDDASAEDHHFEDFMVALCLLTRRQTKSEGDFSINTEALWSPSPLWYQLARCTVRILKSLRISILKDILNELSIYRNFLFPWQKENYEWHLSTAWLIQMRELYKCWRDIRYQVSCTNHCCLSVWKSFIWLWWNQMASCLFMLLLTKEEVAFLGMPKQSFILKR